MTMQAEEHAQIKKEYERMKQILYKLNDGKLSFFALLTKIFLKMCLFMFAQLSFEKVYICVI